MKKLFALLLVVVMVFSLAACSGDEKNHNDPNLGIYKGHSVEVLGEVTPMSEVYSGRNQIELKSGGKGSFTLEGDTIDCEWELKGKTLTISIEGEDSRGTLEEGVIVLDFMGMGMDMTFVKSGAKAPEMSTSTDSDDDSDGGPVSAVQSTVRYFDAYSMTDGGEEYDRETLDMMGLSDFLYVIFYGDGTGRIALGEEEIAVTWDRDNFYLEGIVLPYDLEGDLITIELEGMEFVFHRSSEEPPEPNASGTVPDGGFSGDELSGGEFPAEFIEAHSGDWHGMMEVYDATGDLADNVGSQMEVIARFVFNEDGSCTPFIAAALTGDDSNFSNLRVSYNEYGDLMILEGEFIDKPITENSNLYALGGVLMMDIYVDDGEGNTINLIASLRRLDDAWDYDYDYPVLPEDAVAFYQGMNLEEIAELFGINPGELPVASAGSGDGNTDSGSDGASGGSPTENPGFSGSTAEYDYGEKGQIFFNYPSDTYTFEHKFGVDSLNANDGSLKISFVADWGMDDYEEVMAGYDKYIAESGGVKEEGLSYGGYEATRVTWENVIGDVSMETYLLFGEGHGDYVGVNVIATAGSQANLDANMDVIEAILHSVQLK